MSHEDIGADYEYVKRIGQGAHGTLHVYLHVPSGTEFAVKFISRNEAADINTKREIFNQLKLEHNNVIRLKEIILTSLSLAVVMEYAKDGDLFSFVARQDGRKVPEKIARYFFQQLISGLDYIECKKICHRDIKLENVLLSGHPPLLKICDFGYAKGSLDSNPHSKVGTIAYCAPEILRTPANTNYDAKACCCILCSQGFTRFVTDKNLITRSLP